MLISLLQHPDLQLRILGFVLQYPKVKAIDLAMLLVFSFLLIFPFFTYYVATTLFYRKVNSDSIGKTPPTVPYLIPGVFHAFSLAYEGPQKYFATLMYEFVVRHPSHGQSLMNTAKTTAASHHLLSDQDYKPTLSSGTPDTLRRPCKLQSTRLSAPPKFTCMSTCSAHQKRL